MLQTPDAVLEALRENAERPYGPQRTVAAEELVEAAEQLPEPGLLVTALLELMSAYEFTGEYRKSPVVFARVLQLQDTAPESFDDWEARQVLWRFKWVTTSLLQVPDVPLTAINGWIDQMRDRYRAAGHGQQPVAAMRYEVAAHTGTNALADFEAWTTQPRTELSDCHACEIRHRALHHVRTGDDRQALQTWRPVFEGEATCREEPGISQAHVLLPLLRQGRADEARSHHLSGYRAARGKTGMAEEIGLHLEFCALTRNEGRGLEILAENRALFEATGAPWSHLSFLTGVEALMHRLVEDGHAATAVPGPIGRAWTARELLAHAATEAGPLAEAFDTRNGTTEVGDRRRERLARRPLTAEPLPLGLRATTVPGTPAPALRPPVPEDLATLVARARSMAAEGHPGDTALWKRIAERVGAPDYVHDPALGPWDRLRAELAEERAFAASHQDRPAEERAAMAEAAKLFEGIGMPWHAVAARARAACPSGTSLDEPTAQAVHWDALDAALRDAQRLLAAGTPDEAPATAAQKYLVVLQCQVHAANSEVMRDLADISPAARERFDTLARTLLAEADRLGVPHQRSVAHQYWAGVAAGTGQLDEAAAHLRQALDALQAADQPWRTPRPQGLLAQVRLQQGRAEEAVPLLQQALATVAHYDDAFYPVTATLGLLGHACAHAGDLSGAVRHLSEAAARLDKEGNANGAAELRLELADALTRSGQRTDAVAVLESLLPDDGATALNPRLAAQIRLDLGRGLTELEEHRAAAEEFLRLAGTVAAWEDGGGAVLTLAAAEAAVALARAGRWDAARSACEQATVAHRDAPNPGPIAHMMRELASLTMAQRGPEGLETALEYLAACDAVRAAVPDGADFVHWYQAGATHYERARALAGAERFAEALAEMERAISAYEPGGPPAEAPRAEAVRVAALIEGDALGAREAAAARLTAAIARCERAGLPDAAEILANVRERMGAEGEG